MADLLMWLVTDTRHAGLTPSLLVSNVVSVCGLLLVAYKTAKVLKTRVDISVAVIEEEYRHQQEAGGGGGGGGGGSGGSGGASVGGAPATALASPPLPQVAHAPPSASSLPPHQAQGGAPLSAVDRQLAAAEVRVELLLQFWILFGVCQAAAAYHILYATELRAALVLLGAAPMEFTAAWLPSIFGALAPPLYGVHIPAGIRWLRAKARAAGGILSPLLRSALVSVCGASLLTHAAPSELLQLETALEGATTSLRTERRRRRKIELQAPARGMSLWQAPTTTALRLDAEDEETALPPEFRDFDDALPSRVRGGAGGGSAGGAGVPGGGGSGGGGGGSGGSSSSASSSSSGWYYDPAAMRSGSVGHGGLTARAAVHSGGVGDRTPGSSTYADDRSMATEPQMRYRGGGAAARRGSGNPGGGSNGVGSSSSSSGAVVGGGGGGGGGGGSGSGSGGGGGVDVTAAAPAPAVAGGEPFSVMSLATKLFSSTSA